MLKLAGVLLLLAAVLQSVCSQRCEEIGVTVTYPHKIYRTINATLLCEYNVTTATSVTWRWREVGDTFGFIYFPDMTDDDLSYPAVGFENEIDGRFVDNTTHSLIIINSPCKYDGSEFECIVTTPECSISGQSNQSTTTLNELRDGGRPILSVDAQEACDRKGFPTSKAVICSVASDPASSVDLYGADGGVLKDIEAQSCDEGADGLWTCSVKAMFVKAGQVICKSTFLDESSCTGGACDEGIIMSALHEGLTDLEIGFLCWAVIEFIGLAICIPIIIYLVLERKGNCS